MSAEFDRLRELAVEIARHEQGRRVREIGMENRGPIVDVYLRTAGFDQGVMDSPTAAGANDRMWCGAFIYWCYLQASRRLNQPLPFSGTHLWGGRRLRIWAARHTDARVADGNVQSGDIFAIRNDHIGIATGTSVNGIFPTIEGNQGTTSSAWNGIAPSSQNIANCIVVVRI